MEVCPLVTDLQDGVIQEDMPHDSASDEDVQQEGILQENMSYVATLQEAIPERR